MYSCEINHVMIIGSLTLSKSNMSDSGYLSVAVNLAKARLMSVLKGPVSKDSELLIASSNLYAANGEINVTTRPNYELLVNSCLYISEDSNPGLCSQMVARFRCD